MSIVIRSRESWLASTLRPSFKSHVGLREWVKAEDWTPLAGVTKKRLYGTVHSPETFGEACVRDAIRLGIAAFESAAFVDAPAADERSCAWQFIKYYYAAYFAANGLMRLSGHASINLTAMDCASINAWTLAHGVGGSDDRNKLVAGLYQLTLESSRTPTFAIRLHGGKGGVHIQFWSGFLSYLAALRSDVKRSPAPRVEREAALADLDLLESELKQGGLTQASWLSEMRNAVNYRFEHAAWFPYSVQQVDKRHLRDSFKVHALGADRFTAGKAAGPELVRATRSCGYIVGWLRNSLQTVAGQCKGEKATLSRGALEFAERI
jgi:hypothetical protein